MRRLTLTAALVLILAAAPLAVASAPVIERSTVQRHFDDFYVCEGFDVIGDFTVRRTTMEFPNRFVIHRDIDGTVTNSATGVAYPYSEHDALTFYADGRVVNTGEAAHIVVPGEGTVALIAGRLSGDEVHGRSEEPLICEALR